MSNKDWTSSMDKEKSAPKKVNHPNCFHCAHYFVTWDKYTPKGCQLYGLKSMEIPSVLVQRTTGYPCLGFEVRKVKGADAT